MKIVDPGMLKSKYVMYTIMTPSKGFSVERRYSDFVTLRQEMIKEYPGYVIPPLPVKRITGNIDPSFVQERKVELQLFLNDILRHPLLWKYELIIDFLSLTPREWDAKVKQINKIVIPKEIEHYETIEGEAKLLFTEKTKEYSYRLLASTKDIKDCLSDLRTVNKSIASDFERLGASMEKAGQLYQRLCEVYRSLNVKGYDELLLGMYEGHYKAGEIYKNIREEVLGQFGDFFTFFANEITAYEELLLKKKSVGEHMEMTERRLTTKKEKKFEVKNTSSWELDASAISNGERLLTDKALAFREMLPKESQEARKCRMLYGYYTNKVIEEFNRLLDKNEEPFKRQFMTTIKALAGRQEDLKQIWLQLSDQLTELIVAVTEAKGSYKEANPEEDNKAEVGDEIDKDNGEGDKVEEEGVKEEVDMPALQSNEMEMAAMGGDKVEESETKDE